MGYEIDKVEDITMYNKETGEKIGSFMSKGDQLPSLSFYTAPPKANTMFIISNGWGDGGKTIFYIYRPKKFNWFQRLMWKVCFGVTIKLGEDLSI